MSAATPSAWRQPKKVLVSSQGLNARTRPQVLRFCQTCTAGIAYLGYRLQQPDLSSFRPKTRAGFA
jgi:hypothetical protein